MLIQPSLQSGQQVGKLKELLNIVSRRWPFCEREKSRSAGWMDEYAVEFMMLLVTSSVTSSNSYQRELIRCSSLTVGKVDEDTIVPQSQPPKPNPVLLVPSVISAALEFLLTTTTEPEPMTATEPKLKQPLTPPTTNTESEPTAEPDPELNESRASVCQRTFCERRSTLSQSLKPYSFRSPSQS